MSVMRMKDVHVMIVRINKIIVQSVLPVVVLDETLHVVQQVKHGIQRQKYVK